MQLKALASLRRDMRLGTLLLTLGIADSAAADWHWTGGVSPNWSDVGNWNSAANGSGSNPASSSALQGQDLWLYTTKPNLPSNQNIASLAVDELKFDATVTSFTVSGQAIQIDNVLNVTASPPSAGGAQTVTFQNPLVINSAAAWPIRQRCVIRVEGGLGEASGSRWFVAKETDGRVEFRSAVTTTGGWRNNPTLAAFYGLHTLGILPTSPVADYFSTANGKMSFQSPDGAPFVYELDANVGLRTTGTLTLDAGDNVTTILHGPVSEDAANRGIAKTGNGALYLLGNSTFSGGINVGGGRLILGAPVANGDGTKELKVTSGFIDLNGHDILGRKLTFSNSGNGYVRNANRGTAARIDGDMTSVSNVETVQFGGAGDLRFEGNVTTNTASYKLAKTGAGTLTWTGSSVYSGPVQISGGTLALDYADDNGGKIGDAATLSLHATLSVAGNAAAPTVETVGPLSIGSLSNTAGNLARLSVAGRGGQPATLRFSTLACGTGSEVDFAPGTGGDIRTSTIANEATTAALPCRMVFQGRTFARVGASADGSGYYPIEGLPDGAYVAAFDSGTAYEFVDVAGAMTLATAQTAAALRFDSPTPSTLTLGALLNLNGENSGANYRGAVLVTPDVGANATEIAGAATLAQAGVNGWLHVHQYNPAAALTISARVNEFSSGTGLVKSGPGELILSNGNNNFLNLAVYEGTLTLKSIANGSVKCSAGYGTTMTLGAATIQYTGPAASADRTIGLRSHGALAASGTGKLTLTAATLVSPSQGGGSDPELMLTGTGEGEVQGALALSDGSLVKAGAGTWTLAATSTSSFWGGTRVDAGTLVVEGTLGKDVTVGASGTLAGSGNIERNLTVDGTLAFDVAAGGLTVGRHADIAGATLAVSGVVGATPVAVLTCGETLTGEFAYVTPGYDASYTANAVMLATAPPSGTVIMVR